MMVEESLHKYTIALYERVTPGDLEQDLYDTIKKTGAGTIAGTIAGVGAMTKYAHRKYIEKHVLPKMMNKYAAKLEKDIEEWHDKYDAEFLTLTNDAIARAKLAIPEKAKANSPEGIQTYNTHIKSISRAYKNMYLRYLEGLHGLLRREYAVMTKHIVKVIEKEGWGSISNKSKVKLTDRWDKIIRDENTRAYARMKETLDTAENKLNNELGPNNALGVVLHERPTAFFSADDYTKISSFLAKTIEDISAKEVEFVDLKEPKEEPKDTDLEYATKVLKYAVNKYKYLDNNSVSSEDKYDESKLALDKLRSIKPEVLSSALQKKNSELISKFKRIMIDNEPIGGTQKPISDDEKYIDFADDKVDDLLRTNSLSTDEIIDELSKVQERLKKIKEEKLQKSYADKMNDILSKLSDNIKSLKTGQIEDIVSQYMSVIYNTLQAKKNAMSTLLSYSTNDIYEFSHEFAIKYLENPTGYDSSFKLIKSRKIETGPIFNRMMEQFTGKYTKNITNAIKKIYNRLKAQGLLSINMANYEFRTFADYFVNSLISDKNKHVKEYNEIINDVVKGNPNYESITPEKFMFLIKKYNK